MTTQSPDTIIQKIDRGFPAVAQAAIDKARQTNTKLVVWRDGKIIEIEPENDTVHTKPA